jgi:hypothetical protein
MTLSIKEIKKARIRWYILPGIGIAHPITLTDIEDAVCSSPWCTITKDELVSNSRMEKYSYTRSVCMLLAKILLKNNEVGRNSSHYNISDLSIYSPSLLKKRYGFSGHSSVCLNVKHYMERMNVDKNFRQIIQEIQEKILSARKKEILL